MSIKVLRPTSLDCALAVLNELALKKEDIVFKGLSDPSWRICSTLSRYSVVPHESWDPHIDEMLSHFLTNLRSIGEFLPEIARDRRARLEYGRHYGVPSPLIDFSLSPYVALFFAFNGTRRDRNKPEQKVLVSALDVSALGLGWAKKTGNLDEEYQRFMYEQPEPIFENGYPADVLKYIRFPASWNRRMQRQMGVFIYDALNYANMRLKDLEDFIEKLKEPKDATTGITSPTLTKVFIPRSLAPDAFSQLELMGVTATKLFDDHSGAAADVCNAYNYNRKTGYAWDLSMPPPNSASGKFCAECGSPLSKD